MPLTQLDPTAALIVIDLQKGVVGIPAAHPIAEIVARAAQLARAFRERKLPVVLVNVAGRAPGRTDAGIPKFSFPPDWAELVPELNAQPGDIHITKHRIGAFLGTSLDEQLRQRGVTQIFMAGISTTMGVESTARGAHDLGYNVVFVTDAMTDRDPDAHNHSLGKIFPRIGESDSTENVLKMMNKPQR
jgi:nicotinamidase-related amidase